VIECVCIVFDTVGSLPIVLDNVPDFSFELVLVVTLADGLADENYQTVKFIAIKDHLLDVLFIVGLLFFMHLFCNVRVSLAHSFFSYSVQLIVVHLLLKLLVQRSALLHRVRWVFAFLCH
jgi:hypothetical protein